MADIVLCGWICVSPTTQSNKKNPNETRADILIIDSSQDISLIDIFFNTFSLCYAVQLFAFGQMHQQDERAMRNENEGWRTKSKA